MSCTSVLHLMSEDIKKFLVKFSQEEYDERNTAQFEGIHTEAAVVSRADKHAMKILLEEQKDQERLQAEATGTGTGERHREWYSGSRWCFGSEKGQ